MCERQRQEVETGSDVIILAEAGLIRKRESE